MVMPSQVAIELYTQHGGDFKWDVLFLVHLPDLRIVHRKLIYYSKLGLVADVTATQQQ